jgi:hypothetical protein
LIFQGLFSFHYTPFSSSLLFILLSLFLFSENCYF